MIDKEVIKNNFSKCAKVYDRYSHMQNLCAGELIKRLKAKDFKRILDIGCGTGNYTGLLKARFPKARIKAVDISNEMIEISKTKLGGKNIKFITADAEKINFKEHFDLISSNAALQWFSDLEIVLEKYAGYLERGGFILFSLFGPATFFELEASLKIFSKNNQAIAAADFLAKEKIEEIMKNIFKKVRVEEEVYQENYNSLKDLLKTIKYTGVRGSLKQNLWTQNKLSAVEDAYLKNFKVITATYQVYFCRGMK